MKNPLKKMKNKLPSMDQAVDGFVALLITLGAVAFLYAGFSMLSALPSQDQKLSRGSVKILRTDERSGGSGMVFYSTPSMSAILTNSHVCKVVEHGGVVVEDNGTKHRVTTYKSSQLHDLCVVTVAADLHVNAKFAKTSPSMYSKATIIGHPKLNPTTITKGVFSHREIIDVMTGIRPCTKDDVEKNPDNILLCMFLGGIPQMSTYETQFVTAEISPGSSGSPVFNEDGEISGVVFAGSGDHTPGFIVPLESVLNFISPLVEDGSGLAGSQLPNNQSEISLGQAAKSAFETSEFEERFDRLCSDEKALASQSIKRICNSGRDSLWRN